MTKYEAQWSPSRNTIIHTIEAENENDAFDKAVSTYKYPATKHVWVSWDGGLKDKRFDNPHFDPNYVEPVEEDSKMATIPRPDGSVGWYENLGEKSLSDRDILIAQLHELRTIKRCVVCTILIVIVIPIVFGVIASA